MRSHRFAGLLAVVIWACSPVASADETVDRPLQEIRAEQINMREAAVAGSDRFEHMTESRRREVVSRQNELLAMIEGKQRLDELAPEEQAELADSIRWIEDAITQAEESRIVCRRERVLGSNRKVRICKSVAQMRREREEAHEQLDGPPTSRMKEMGGM